MRYYSVLFSLLAVGLIGVACLREADAARCDSNSRGCSFNMGGGKCCYTVTSIPDTVAPPAGETGPFNWIADTPAINCGVEWTGFLIFNCWRITATGCGTAATPLCE